MCQGLTLLTAGLVVAALHVTKLMAHVVTTVTSQSCRACRASAAVVRLLDQPLQRHTAGRGQLNQNKFYFFVIRDLVPGNIMSPPPDLICKWFHAKLIKLLNKSIQIIIIHS